ncbi:hypothetical protein BD311DRAFT_774613 [Dichomitus squalens]|uniref:Arrestin-like N-terminal domain-containing protein n=1 Tax=Dichomitus squalens TaxID=114155 RepID=A0A4Q9MZH4_9APHY|nr:hypothetical protein BD311DRAFT_774613 [Dichomitus squalens]
MVSTPPAYPLGFAAASQLDVSQALPGYTRTVGLEWDVPAADRHHKFHLTKKTGERWLTLSLTSRAATVADTPTFFQGGDVSGSLQLQLDNEELVDGITVAVSVVKYTTSDKSPGSSEASSVAARRGRLQGRYDWPYSFRLPKGVSILSSITTNAEVERQSYRLPPSFSDEHSNVIIQYSLVVRVDRGGLRKGSKLVVPIVYVPLARPGPPTILRQLAYQQCITIPGPDVDPVGWKTSEPVKVEGTLFKTIQLEALCTLTYTRGAPIHLIISIRSNNRQFLDLLTPQSMHVALLQHITFGDEGNQPRFSRRLSAQITMKTRSLAVATWWRVSNPATSSDVRTFAGEVLIPDDAVPACRILHYGHEV